MIKVKNALFISLLSIGLCSCNKDEQSVAPSIANETITTVTLQLVNKDNPSDIVTAGIDNLNATPDLSKDTLKLKANTTYLAKTILKDNTQPAFDLTGEIKIRSNIHLFIYTPESGLNLTATITDKDTNPAPGPYPLGLEYQVVTSSASKGKFNVVLRHQPNVKNGTPAPGSTDLDVDFGVEIK